VWEPIGSDREASSIARSGERRGLEGEAVAAGIAEQIARWQAAGDWQKIECMELMFVLGWGNKQVAERLRLSEQQVANFKFDFLERLRKIVRAQRLNEDIFPELHE
jgi:RNA polymerase sigma-70 factor (ECF subfamily)